MQQPTMDVGSSTTTAAAAAAATIKTTTQERYAAMNMVMKHGLS